MSISETRKDSSSAPAGCSVVHLTDAIVWEQCSRNTIERKPGGKGTGKIVISVHVVPPSTAAAHGMQIVSCQRRIPWNLGRAAA